MKESETQSAIISYLKARGILYWRCSLGGVRLGNGAIARNTMKGFPDLAGIYRGHFFTIEVKKKKGKLSKEQEEWRIKLIANGTEYSVATSVDDVIGLIQRIEGKLDGKRNRSIETILDNEALGS